MDNTNEMQELIDELNTARSAYYNGKEVMTNFEYDSLYDELTALEKETGTVLPGSPTQSVGYAPAVMGLVKVRHEYPALSLDKTKDIDAFVENFNLSEAERKQYTNQVILMWKLDGSTCQVTVDMKDGKEQIVLAATRGNGEVGCDITHNIHFVGGIPAAIPKTFNGKFVIRGEVTMRYSEFNKINESLPEGTEPYANPRNLANATISMLDPEEMRRRPLEFHAFQLVYAPADVMPDTFSGRLGLIKEMGFDIVPFTGCVLTELKRTMERWGEMAKSLDIPVDGLVGAYEWCRVTDGLHGTAHNPNTKKQFAFKWADETKETKLRKIEWSASRTGLLNPVAVFDPIDLEGTTVARASVSNLSGVERLHLHVGDTITVFKANMIIPQIADNLSEDKKTSDGRPAYGTDVCPVCGAKTQVRVSKDGASDKIVKTLWCTNDDCAAKHVGKLVHFCERDCMNIEGMSEATVTKLVDAGFLKKFADFYTLKNHADEIKIWEGFGEKSVENLLAAIEKSKTASFVPFIHALGIPNVGKGQAKLIEKECIKDPLKLRNKIEKECMKDPLKFGNKTTVNTFIAITFIAMLFRRYDWTKIQGFGEVINNSLNDWALKYVIPFLDTDEYPNKDAEFVNLLSCIHFVAETTAKTDSGKFTGMTFVITGSVMQFKNRDDVKKFIEDNGGRATDSVTSKTSYLVNNDVNSTSGKNKKAKELGVPVISEEQLIKMVK